jgi:hypothetical protein
VFTTVEVAVGTGWGLLNVLDGVVVIGGGWKSLWLVVGVGYGMLTPNCKSIRRVRVLEADHLESALEDHHPLMRVSA